MGKSTYAGQDVSRFALMIRIEFWEVRTTDPMGKNGSTSEWEHEINVM